MNDNENKKNNETLENVRGGVIDEALPDDVLENVAGGGFKDWLKGLFVDDPGSSNNPTGGTM